MLSPPSKPDIKIYINTIDRADQGLASHHTTPLYEKNPFYKGAIYKGHSVIKKANWFGEQVDSTF